MAQDAPPYSFLHNERTFRVSEVHKLEDPERQKWLPPDDVISALKLQRGMTVADIGAGTGYFAIPMSRIARVFAVDFQREMLELLRAKKSSVELIEGEARATTLASESCDVALLANVWHELEQRGEVLAEMKRILKPGGMLAILDWRHDVERPPGPSIEHRIPADRVVEEVSGWGDVRVRDVGSFSYLVTAVSLSHTNR